jgi:hypothetical protein
MPLSLYQVRIKINRCVCCGKKLDRPGRKCTKCSAAENARHSRERRIRREMDARRKVHA